MTDTTDQFQPLRDAPPPIGPDVGAGRNMYFAGQHGAEEPADTASRLALVAQRDALLAEVERLTAELAAAPVDAERYRWLREQHTYDGEGDEPALTRWFVQAGREPVPCDPGMLDAAIDAARTA